MLVHSLLMKSRKRVVHDVTDICATHAGLVHGVTASVKMAPLMGVFSQLLNVDY